MVDLTDPLTLRRQDSQAKALLAQLYVAVDALKAAQELTPLVVMNDETGDFVTFNLDPDLDHLRALADELFSIVSKPNV